MSKNENPIEREKSMDKIDVAASASEAITSSKVALGTGGGVSAVAWWQALDWLAIVGLTLAAGGFIMNFYYSHKRNAREQAEHEYKMKQMRKKDRDEE